MDRYPYLGTLYYLTSVYLRIVDALFIYFFIFLMEITNTPIVFLTSFPRTNKSLVLRQKRHQVFSIVVGILWCFMLISMPSASFVLQTFFFYLVLLYFIFLFYYDFLFFGFLFCRFKSQWILSSS